MTKAVFGDTQEAEFSYAEYKAILQEIKLDLKDYTEAKNADSFAILRHDVEFSVSRAHKMAQIENEYDVSSTFFFQVISSAYNPLSVENGNLIKDMRDMGHHIGLHLYVSHVHEGDWKGLEAELARQKTVFETGLDLDCNRFSFHRPPKWTLENRRDDISGLLNAYGPSFFEFSGQPTHIKYVADSKHQWSHGHPLDDFDQNKIQILIHPDEWSERGASEKHYFKELVDEHQNHFIDTLDNETQHFKMYRNDML